MARCRDCKLYDLDAVKNARGAVMSKRAARCLWVSKEVWPDSVYENMNHRPRPAYMEPSQGERCKCFIPRPLP
jgi:hypothetical protein